jgi:uncharacterized membrane protein
VVLAACTLGAGLPGAVDDALWEDELASEHVISEPTVRDALSQVVRSESAPPAYYLLARIADRPAVGLTLDARARALRGLSILFAIGCTLLTFALAAEFLPHWAAALAGVLATFGSVLVVHGSELRAYALLALCCVALALALERAVAEPTRRRLTLLAAVTAVGSLTHYFFLFTLAAGVVWLLISGRTRRVVGRVSAAIAVGLVPLLVWLPFWVRQYQHGRFATSPRLTFARFVDLMPSLFVPDPLVHDAPLAARIAVTLAVLVAAGLLIRRRGAGQLCGVLVLVPVVAVALLAWASGERIFNDRNQIGVTPFAAVALAWGCAALPWRKIGYAAAALAASLVIAGFAWAEAELGRTPYDRIASAMVAQGFRGGEPVLWFGDYAGMFPVAWYLTPDLPRSVWPRIKVSAPTGRACPAVEVVVRERIGRIWLGQHRARILAETRVPSYGDASEQRRVADTVVARLRWSPGILERPSRASRRFAFHRTGARSPCLSP